MSLIVFTDLDGTLLDHATYSHAAAAPALDALKRHGIPLILATSKTAAEVADLHAHLDLSTPAIVENGAGLYRPGDTDGEAGDYTRLRAALADLRPGPAEAFLGFGDIGPEGVARATGLSPGAAMRAAARRFSEPGLWQGDAAGLCAFVAALDTRGITARQGGRFLTLSFGATKAARMAGIMAELGRNTAIALGDAPNDAEMLEAADHGVIIRNDHGAPVPALPGESLGRIHRTTLPGPAGWNEAILGLLTERGYQ